MDIMECRNIRENETMKGNMEIQLLKLVVFSYIHIVIIVIAVIITILRVVTITIIITVITRPLSKQTIPP